jgi:hypothetical protein
MKTQAQIYFELTHYNLTDEEEDKLAPFACDNLPSVVCAQYGLHRYVYVDRAGPQVVEAEGRYKTFADGSRLFYPDNSPTPFVLNPS